MAEVIRMPKMSDTMEEGVIAAWNVKVGDKISSGDILAEVETDKATMDMESYYEGTLLYIGVEKGDAVPVNSIIAVVGEEGEDYKSLLDGEGGSGTKEEAAPAKEEAAEAAPAQSSEKIDTSGIKAQLVKMPLLSDTMTEGVIHAWLKKVGDKVESGDMLAEIETDKATMELEAYEEGTLLHIGVKEGEAVPVNSVIAVIGEEGADFETLLKAEAQADAAPVKEEKKEAAPAAASEAKKETPSAEKKEAAPASSSKSAGGRILASPLAKKLAEEKGIDIALVDGSGEGGRIIKVDIDNYVPAAAPAAAAPGAMAMPTGSESSEEIKLTQMRKAIARSLTDSQSTAVTFQLTMEINMDKAMQARASMNEISPVKISFNDLVVKACGVALRQHPNVNSSWRDDHIRRNKHVHIGMAVAIEDGLVVPVIRFADTLPLSTLAATTKDLGGKAKSGKLQPADWEGNTFTVSNLGMFGIEQFTSIINNPKNESCILSVGGIKETVAVKNGEFYATNIMKVTMTCDHRVVDGATGAAFLVTLKQLLEDPARMLV
ncbi:2-oxo acid dehydrogenase subunit E2 [Jiulongibacter sediminis]|uniref:Dihydrolipoamide acetyltransferase component of pyruvate dehydrogenase complex n=1 Tax=Jiulongibacter sediminis TaxID=1605367 RepID=A0A0P7C0G4_9BACT|nr:2-oxo acid dehydrogenase subunit E2 [Jiulongibacter sediminis]KPM50109.1 pyruvate dehydrogenase [Jiulongibacter sediminis]TBX27129.1 pyruvate dehydrogenase [Jiulongibacter sediminis]